MPRWFALLNKRLFNKPELSRGVRPALAHLGRSSGNTYFTPLDAYPVESGYMFTLVYGSRSDWVRNVLASGTARLTIDGEEHDLVSPRLVTKEDARKQLPAGTKAPPGFLRVSGYLQMDISR